MLRDFDDAVLFQHGIFGEHAVDAATECACLHLRARLPAGPALEETPRHLVAGFDTCNAGTHLDDFARAVGERHDVVAYRHAVGTAHDAEVAIIERAGSDL